MVIRPVNLIFFSTYFFLDITSFSGLSSRIKSLLVPKTLIYILIGVSFSILPQILYWQYMYGIFLYYSYGSEGFNWLNPELVSVLFATSSGLFLYVPFYLFIISSLIVMIKKKYPNGIFILALFSAITYIISCWWDWGFGCSFGTRSLVEYLSILSIPVAYGFTQLNKLKTLKRVVVYSVILLIIVINLKMSYAYDGCFYGTNNWDWNTYQDFLISLVNV